MGTLGQAWSNSGPEAGLPLTVGPTGVPINQATRKLALDRIREFNGTNDVYKWKIVLQFYVHLQCQCLFLSFGHGIYWQAILTAATDTTTSTLIWALALMLNNKQVMKKAQEEIDINIGKERQVEEPDMKNLVYLQAVIKETLRLYPPVPLWLPHESTEECTVGGYRIPKGTRLLLNLSKIHRDPQAWLDPSEFQPERFLTSDKEIDVRGQNYELNPFGSGRRMCPGISLGLQVLQLTLASLIHGFEFARPLNQPIDVTECFGLTNLKATPPEVLLTPRLSPGLYGTN
ncbi:hypothetical protein RJ639_005813 [Escallonia herrerae]|uniref:Cytochrome P450 n=1 Tax=Escallonia herrerae TaxID=1293975 RepID=A0AA88VYP6_9ASTE|nr:hypothetical protein RJ639_005813 [Escallonia herrerae]